MDDLDDDDVLDALEDLGDERPMTYREIAAVLGTSKTNVQDIANRALAKMRARLSKGVE